MNSELPEIYEMKIVLRSSKPPIWRRVQVRSNATLPKFHLIIQRAMGWENAHLHMFEVGGVRYSTPDPDETGYDEELGIKSEYGIRLNRLGLSSGSRIRYQYDFGDNWWHDITLERVLSEDPLVWYPVCIAGQRACPPEDCGGVVGYAKFLQAIRDENHPEHDELKTWIGGVFDPDGFDINSANRLIRKIR